MRRFERRELGAGVSVTNTTNTATIYVPPARLRPDGTRERAEKRGELWGGSCASMYSHPVADRG